MSKKDLQQNVIMSARDYGISTTLYRHKVGTKLGVNVTDMECLAVLFFKGVSTPKELSEYTGLSSGATTAMLDRLEKGGLIERRPNPNDRRGTLIVVKEAAKAHVGPLFAGVREAQDKLTSGYSEQDLKLITSFLQRLTELWEDQRKKL
jgi:DNA-binding MarR family transcriptional regulator